MTEQYCADVRVAEGDVVELPSDVDAQTVKPAGGGSLRVVATGTEPREVVVLVSHYEHGEELSVPETATILSVDTGRSKMEDSRIFYTIPTDEY